MVTYYHRPRTILRSPDPMSLDPSYIGLGDRHFYHFELRSGFKLTLIPNLPITALVCDCSDSVPRHRDFKCLFCRLLICV